MKTGETNSALTPSPNDAGAAPGIRQILAKVAQSLLNRVLTPRIAARWRRIRTGMTGDHAREALGMPDQTYPFGFGGSTLTLWVYDQREEPVYLWLDEAGTVKMTCRTGAGASP
jgi:hypothetical protein